MCSALKGRPTGKEMIARPPLQTLNQGSMVTHGAFRISRIGKTSVIQASSKRRLRRSIGSVLDERNTGTILFIVSHK